MLGSHSPASSDKATVLVADATPMDCQLVSEAIQRHNHFRVIGRVVSSGDTISAVCRVQPDVALISARLQDGAFAGLLALRGLRALQARSRIVMVLTNVSWSSTHFSTRRGVFFAADLGLPGSCASVYEAFTVGSFG